MVHLLLLLYACFSGAKRDTTVSSLSDYVIKNVKQTSVRENDGKMQTPTIMPSSSLMSSWQELKLR